MCWQYNGYTIYAKQPLFLKISIVLLSYWPEWNINTVNILKRNAIWSAGKKQLLFIWYNFNLDPNVMHVHAFVWNIRFWQRINNKVMQPNNQYERLLKGISSIVYLPAFHHKLYKATKVCQRFTTYSSKKFASHFISLLQPLICLVKLPKTICWNLMQTQRQSSCNSSKTDFPVRTQ